MKVVRPAAKLFSRPLTVACVPTWTRGALITQIEFWSPQRSISASKRSNFEFNHSHSHISIFVLTSPSGVLFGTNSSYPTVWHRLSFPLFVIKQILYKGEQLCFRTFQVYGILLYHYECVKDVPQTNVRSFNLISILLRRTDFFKRNFNSLIQGCVSIRNTCNTIIITFYMLLKWAKHLVWGYNKRCNVCAVWHWLKDIPNVD